MLPKTNINLLHQFTSIIKTGNMAQMLSYYFMEAAKKNELDHLRLAEMQTYLATVKTPPKLTVRGRELVMNKKLIKQLSKRAFNPKTNVMVKVFKMTTEKNSIRYSPFFLNKNAQTFFQEASKTLGDFHGEPIMDSISTLKKHQLMEQTILDRLMSLYIKNSGIYLGATKNLERKAQNKNPSRHYVAPNDLMRKYLRPSLESIVNGFKEKEYESEQINFKDGVETIDALLDFRIYNAGGLRKGMTAAPEDLTEKQKKMIGKMENDKVIKEYVKLLWKAKIEGKLDDKPSLPEDAYLQAAVEISEMTFVNSEGAEYKLGPYTAEQISTFEVNWENDSIKLAVRAVLDTEKAFTKRFRDEKEE